MHSFREHLYHLWKKSSEKQSRTKYNIHFKDDIQRFHQCKDKKPAGQIKHEMKALQKFWHCFPYQYYRYDFFEKSCPLTLKEMMGYVPNFFMYNLFFPRSFMDYGILCEHKGLTYPVLSGFGIPQPKMLLRFDDDLFFNEQNQLISDDEAEKILLTSGAEKLFIKPSFGLGGNGITVYRKDPQGFFVNESNEQVTAMYIHRTIGKGKYVIQEGLLQHPELSGIYPHSVNTFRIISEYTDGQPWALHALLRMGRGGNQIDNASAGGLYLKVDLKTGSLSNYAYTHNRIRFFEHPDTGFTFRNARLESWQAIKSFVMREIVKFREIRYLGWDIAMTVNGPVVIELNNGPDVEILQDFYGGLKDDFKIIPDKWWYNHKFTLKEL
jgi:hypothetical protein